MTGVAATTEREAGKIGGDEQPDRNPLHPSAEAAPGPAAGRRWPPFSTDASELRPAGHRSSAATRSGALGVSSRGRDRATHRLPGQAARLSGLAVAAVVAAHPGADHATISEVVLVPGPTALLAPSWVPWENRVRAGDLGPGDLLAPPPDDPGWCPDTPQAATPRSTTSPSRSAWAAGRCWARGPGRHRRALARRRSRSRCADGAGDQAGLPRLWLHGSAGRGAGHHVRVCCNELSADGHVVDFEYGCGRTPTPPGATGWGRIADVMSPVRRSEQRSRRRRPGRRGRGQEAVRVQRYRRRPRGRARGRQRGSG